MKGVTEMAAGENDPSILSSLPLWVQVAANLGMFVVAVIAASFGYMRRLAGVGHSIVEHEEAKPDFKTTGDDIRSLKDSIHRLADAADGILTVLKNREREEEIQREVDRRVKDQN